MRHRRRPDGPSGLLRLSPERSRTRHERYLPSDDLAGYVEHYWTVAWDFRGEEPYRVETLPYPSVHVLVEPGSARVGGVNRGKFVAMLEDEGWVFGIKFLPGAFRPFFGAPISRLTDRAVPIRRIFGAAGEKYARAVRAAPDTDARIDLAEAFLRVRLPEPDSNVALAVRTVALIRADRRIVKVDDLVDRVRMTKRGLQRLFNRYVGVSPKWVIQRFRLHDATDQLAARVVDGTRLALELGYADQAHFIRHFRASVGLAPGAYARRAGQGRERD